MHLGKIFFFMGQSLFMRIFWGITWFQEGTRGEGGGQASLPGGGTQRKLTANHMGSLEHYRASWGRGGAEESLIVTHPRDK